MEQIKESRNKHVHIWSIDIQQRYQDNSVENRNLIWGRTHVSCIGRWILYHWATREAQKVSSLQQMMVEQPNVYKEKKQPQFLPYIIHKNQHKVEHLPKCKSQN